MMLRTETAQSPLSSEVCLYYTDIYEKSDFAKEQMTRTLIYWKWCCSTALNKQRVDKVPEFEELVPNLWKQEVSAHERNMKNDCSLKGNFLLFVNERIM